MNYLFYTTEGYTQSPDKREIDNCQVLGQAQGKTQEEALQQLLADNPWILEYNYNPIAIIGYQIVE